jgi:signal transduction histidine kinase
LEVAVAEGRFEHEGWLVRKDGSRFWANVVITPLKDENGRLVGFSKVTRDITDRKRAEEDREQLIRELEERNAEQKRFTYAVSHDLKSPLITIRGFVGQLEREIAQGATERVKADIARINKAAGRMQELLDELLDLTRIGRKIDSFEEVPLAELAHNAVDLVAGRIRERGVQVQIAPDMPVVLGDRPRLLEVLQNLIENAVKFMGDQAEPRMEIGARREGNQTVCFVRDNGVGVDPRYQEKIFGLFDKLNPESEGIGMGLSLTRRVLETHHGRIWVESEGEGKGSVFCFAIPHKSQG